MDPAFIIGYTQRLRTGCAVPPLLVVVILLAVAIGVGLIAVQRVRRWLRRDGDDRGVWERALVEWRNLRDEGVLTEEEYRKVRTLVEPRTRIGTPDPLVRQRPAAGAVGPDHERT